MGDLWPKRAGKTDILSIFKALVGQKMSRNRQKRAEIATNCHKIAQFETKIAHFGLFLWAVGRQKSLEMAQNEPELAHFERNRAKNRRNMPIYGHIW